MRIFTIYLCKKCWKEETLRERKSLFYAHKTAVRHTLQHELSVAGEDGILGRGGSLTTRGVPSWLHGKSVAQCRAFCNPSCKNSIFQDKICTCYAEKTVRHTQCSRLFGKVKPPEPSFCGFIASFFSAGRGLQESQQNGLQFLVKSCIMRANLSFDRFRPKSTIDLTPDWAV